MSENPAVQSDTSSQYSKAVSLGLGWRAQERARQADTTRKLEEDFRSRANQLCNIVVDAFLSDKPIPTHGQMVDTAKSLFRCRKEDARAYVILMETNHGSDLEAAGYKLQS